MKRLFLLLSLLISPAAFAENTQQLLQLLDYVGVDYAEAVVDGKVINGGEYKEMEEFAGAIVTAVDALPWNESKAPLQQEAAALAVAISVKRSPVDIATMTGAMRSRIMNSFDIVTVPAQQPDLKLGSALYRDNCMACHGVTGMGDGPAASGLEPSPTNFLDTERYSQRSLFGLYNTITLGVSETAMRPFGQLDDHERWSLAFYVGSLGSASLVKTNTTSPALSPITSLKQLTTTTPGEADRLYGDDGRLAMASLRSNPSPLFASNDDPLAVSRELMAQSANRYSQGANTEAQQLAVTAYLEGFELVESSLSLKDEELSKEIESLMGGYRTSLRYGSPAAKVVEQQQHIDTLLAEAQQALNSQGLSSTGAFSSALVILLREGLEAILVLAALFAFLIKTGRRDATPYLHAGWIGAVIAGFATWWLSTSLFTISGEMREVTEGVAALVAALILFYVGFWMHSKTNARAWQHFIEGSVQKALGTSTLWSLAGLSFISVYREMFETILFYQAIWVQTDTTGHTMVVAGMLSAIAALLVLGWFILRYSTRLPLRQFFAVTGAFLFLLAVVFAGKGIAALQEAGNLPHDPLPLPFAGMFGIADSIEGVLVQGGMVLLTAWLLWGRKGKGGSEAA